MSAEIQKYLQDFFEYLEIEKNRSAQTVVNYRFYLERFFHWAMMQKKMFALSDMDMAMIRKYRLWLHRLIDERSRKPLKNNTQNYHLIALRTFLKYLAKRDVKTLSPEKIELSKMPERKVISVPSLPLMVVPSQLLKVNICDLFWSNAGSGS